MKWGFVSGSGMGVGVCAGFVVDVVLAVVADTVGNR